MNVFIFLESYLTLLLFKFQGLAIIRVSSWSYNGTQIASFVEILLFTCGF